MVSSPVPLAEPVSPAWQTSLVRQLDDLGRWTQGRLVTAADVDGALTPATRYLEPDFLRDAVASMCTSRSAVSAGGADFDLTIAASRFARRYSAPMTVVALAGLAQGVGIDVSLERCAFGARKAGEFAVVVDADDTTVLRCAERPTRWPVAAGGPEVASLHELRQAVWAALYGRHLAPVFRLVHELTGASEALLWASAAEYAGIVSDAAEEYLPADAVGPFLADRHALFGAETLPGVPGPNPLRDMLDWVPVDGQAFPSDGHAFPSTVQTRRLCCLCYLLEERGGYLCANCPYLPVEERAALVAEQHGVPRGGPAGPAVERSRQIGLQRPSLRRRRAAREQ